MIKIKTKNYEITLNKNRNVFMGLTGSGKTSFMHEMETLYSINLTIDILYDSAYYEDIIEDIIVFDDCKFDKESRRVSKSIKTKFYNVINNYNDKLIFSLGRSINIPKSDAWELVKSGDKIINVPYLTRPKQTSNKIPETLILVTEDTCSGYNLWKNLNLSNKIIYPQVVKESGKLKQGGIRCLTQFIREHRDTQYGIILDYVYDNISVLYEIKQLVEDKTLTNYSIISTRTAEELILVDDYLRDNYSLTKEDYNIIKNIILDNDILNDSNLIGTYENRVTQFLKNRIGYSKSKSINIKLNKETNPFLRELQFNKNNNLTSHFG